MSETKARQEIIDAIEELGVQRTKIWKAAEAEMAEQRAAIVARCDALGHIFKRGDSLLALTKRRLCVFCYAEESV